MSARRGRGATSIGEAMRRVGNMARQRSYVVVVSDFRGPRDWRRSLLALSGRHHVVAVEIRDAREQELPKFGLLRLVDPETGRQLKVDTSSDALRAALRRGGREGARRGRLRDHLGRRAPRRASDARRLAARADRLPATRGLAVSFASPDRAVGPAARADRGRRLHLVPAPARARVARSSCRRRCFPNVVDRVPGWRRHLPVALLLLAVTAFLVGFARPHANALGALRAGDGRARDRYLALDGRDRRTPDAACRCAGLGPPVPRGLPRKYRVAVVAFSSRPQVVAAPTVDRAFVTLRDQRPARRAGHGDRRRPLERDPGRDAASAGQEAAAGSEAAARRRFSSSRTARRTAARVPLATAIRQARAAKVPVFTALLGTQDGVVNVPLVGGYNEQIRVPTDPARAAYGRAADRRQVLHGADAGRSGCGLQGPEVAPRQHEQERGDHRGLCGGAAQFC